MSCLSDLLKGPKDEHNAHWWSCVGWRKQSHVIRWQYWILQSFMMVCLIFHTTIIINRKNWRINVKLHFENLSIFFSECTHMLEPPSSSLASVRFCSLFNDPPPSPPWQFLLIVDGCFFYLDRLFYTTPTFAFFFLQSEAGSSNKRDKTKSCRHQSHEGIFVTEIDKYIASFFFDDKGLKLSLLN